MKITKITDAQKRRFAEWSQKWIDIGLSTAPADFDAATEAALKAYALCNLKRPMVILRMGSPYGATLGGALAWGFLREIFKNKKVGSQVESQVRSQVESQVRSQVESQVRSQVRSQVGSQVWSQVGSQVESQVRSQVWSQVWSQVRSQVWSQVGSQVGSQVESQVWSQVGSQVGSQVRSQVGSQWAYNDRGGAFWASWGAYVSFMRDMLGWADPVLERFEIDEALIKSCGWAWWHENVLAISDRPCELHRDAQGRLHSASGPSIAYRDGWKLHHWHGVAVPDYVIEAPTRIKIGTISSESNAEVRRVMVERYGEDRYIVYSGMKPVAHDETFGTLYVEPQQAGTPIAKIRVINRSPEPDGSFKPYWIDVNPAHYGGDAGRIPQAAIASTWRTKDGALAFKNYKDYAPSFES